MTTQTDPVEIRSMPMVNRLLYFTFPILCHKCKKGLLIAREKQGDVVVMHESPHCDGWTLTQTVDGAGEWLKESFITTCLRQGHFSDYHRENAP